MNKINEEIFGFGKNRLRPLDKIEKDNIKKESNIDKLFNNIKDNKYNLLNIKDMYNNNYKKGNTEKCNIYLKEYINTFYDILYDLYKIVKFIIKNDDDELRNKYNNQIDKIFIFMSKSFNGLRLNNESSNKIIEISFINMYFLNRINRLYYDGKTDEFYFEKKLAKTIKYKFGDIEVYVYDYKVKKLVNAKKYNI